MREDSPRVLFLGNDFLPDVGGIQQYVAALVARTPGAAVFADAHPDADDSALPYPVYRGTRRFMWPTPRLVADVARAVADHHTDIVVVTSPFPLVDVARRLRVPYAVICHGAELVMPTAARPVAAIYRRWLRGAACVFAVSNYTAGHVRSVVGPDGPDVHVVHPGVDLQRFTPAAPTYDAIVNPPAAGQNPTIISVGRLVPRKGTDVVLRAMPLIQAEHPEARLMIVGDGRLSGQLQQLADDFVRQATLSAGSVTFAGRVANDEMPQIYRRADVAVMPVRSRWGGLEQEGFGIVFAEAGASGLPVVAGRSGGAPEAVIDGVTGFVVDGDSEKEVARATLAVLNDPELHRRMGAAATAHVHAHFDWDVLARTFMDHLAGVNPDR